MTPLFIYTFKKGKKFNTSCFDLINRWKSVCVCADEFCSAIAAKEILGSWNFFWV